ncbi:DEAD/DEAH box helicase family protein [Paenibacillus glucanolyticus]|jgi:hypothetical protein|uniref:Helicase n=1 Tax=Paenibacillus glucanolyticus TaxID=59843 RepID=A0A163G8P3_9BACL|nr:MULTISPECIES: DEAD/DEAH box helicase family protein [Paenibacillus]KZS44795.1 helicase [Paenibacillus glucanolyticus]MDH6675727.1 hypothetical protein [Paenibacillus sp. LBL]OMF64769.1 helicase [Paenibacillus glucanolyticus]
MKYPIYDNIVPVSKRAEINEKVFYLVENNLCAQYNISPHDVYNTYTGSGGLHGLSFSEFDNFYKYTEAKKELEMGQFFTPHNLCKFIADCIRVGSHDLIGDLTAGMGNFFNFMPSETNCYGNEFDIKAFKVMKYLYPAAQLAADDIRFYNPNVTFDTIFGNPPYNLKWKIGAHDYSSQLFYCYKAFELLKPGGMLVLVVPLSFMSDDFKDSGIIAEMNSRFNFVYQAALPPQSFKSVGVDFFQTKLMVFQKKSKSIPDGKPYSTQYETLSALDEIESSRIHKTYIKPIIIQKDTVRHKLFFENLQNNHKENEFQQQVRKYLFDIKRNPKINEQYARCRNLIDQYYNQKKPKEMKADEWENLRLTKTKVLGSLREVLVKQHETEKDMIRLVKTNYGLRLKGYSKKTRQYLSRLNDSSKTFTEMMLKNEYPFEDQTYIKLVEKKKREFMKQSQPFDEMEQDREIAEFLDKLIIKNVEWDWEIRPNKKQKEDTNKILQKRYGYLQWGQGSGKTISGISNLLYRASQTRIRNTFVVGPAIAIYNTWEVMLNECQIDFIRISSLKDISYIRHGQVVLVTTDMLMKYQRHIKQYIRMQSQKVLLIFDEADIIANPSSKRAKAVKNCFRKVKYKTLLSGTMTRNSIVEGFGQLELLYNNSINMLSECEYIFSRNKKEDDQIEHHLNPGYMQPIPAYMKGYKLFSASHTPKKITVFGVGQDNQDIYNAEQLRILLDKTVITRTFEEVVGRKIYEIVQTTCQFHDSERKLYLKCIEEFHQMRYLFEWTGNNRKDSMLQILNQLTLMLKVCSIPHTFKEYEGNALPSKFDTVFQLLKKWNKDYVAIGVRHKKAAFAYEKAIRAMFPHRPVFVITGDRVKVRKRKEMVKELRNHPNAILISTQQSLSSSMNIGFINKVIIAELSWNDASMSQYYFRFIRFDSQEDKEVHFVTYENSIESNLLGLILAKERLNLFMKNQEKDDEELYDMYGVNFNLLEMLMTKDKDEYGNVHIRWGQQVFVS